MLCLSHLECLLLIYILLWLNLSHIFMGVKCSTNAWLPCIQCMLENLRRLKLLHYDVLHNHIIVSACKRSKFGFENMFWISPAYVPGRSKLCSLTAIDSLLIHDSFHCLRHCVPIALTRNYSIARCSSTSRWNGLFTWLWMAVAWLWKHAVNACPVTKVSSAATATLWLVLEAYSQRDTHTADVADTVKGC